MKRAASTIRAKDGRTPTLMVVLGSGLGGFANELCNATRIPFADIPGMPGSTVPGHEGALVIGELGGLVVAALQGRVHLYEGRSPDEVTLAVRALRSLGAPIAILTNAAGGLATDMVPGTLVVLEDQINLTGRNPLCGPNDETLGPRFPDMTEAYDRALRAVALEEAARIGLTIRSGVYAGLLGPSYETPAEIRMLRTLGADLVGMSTVLEVIALRHMGTRVLGISCVTNLAAGLGTEPLSHDDVQRVAVHARQGFLALLSAVVARIGKGA